MRQNLLISYAVNCRPETLAPWTCYWCKFIGERIHMRQYLVEPSSDTFGFIGETSRNSLTYFFFFF